MLTIGKAEVQEEVRELLQRILDSYKSRVQVVKVEKINRAQREAQRFIKILDETKKAQTITRERLYLETMESAFYG